MKFLFFAACVGAVAAVTPAVTAGKIETLKIVSVVQPALANTNAKITPKTEMTTPALVTTESKISALKTEVRAAAKTAHKIAHKKLAPATAFGTVKPAAAVVAVSATKTDPPVANATRPTGVANKDEHAKDYGNMGDNEGKYGKAAPGDGDKTQGPDAKYTKGGQGIHRNSAVASVVSVTTVVALAVALLM